MHNESSCALSRKTVLRTLEGGKTTIVMPDMTPGKREISVFDGTASVAFHKVARMAKSYWRYLRETS